MSNSIIPSKNRNTSALGKVFLVGAGPGAVDLITVRGAKLLAIADVVFHDALVDVEMLKLCPQAEHVAVGKRCGKLSSAQQFINKRLVDAAHKYKTVIRLKGGDPMLFGRADEEITALKDAGIEVEVIPGITAALAGSASLQQSLTLRGVSRSVAFVTLAQANDEIGVGATNQQLSSPNADTLVYYMGRKDAAKIAQELIHQSKNCSHHGPDTPVHILEAVSTPRERLWSSTLSELADGNADTWFDNTSPALIMIGDALRQSKPSCTKVDNGLQNAQILANSRRCT
jgi:uroporphyrin-III C-methyltransferase